MMRRAKALEAEGHHNFPKRNVPENILKAKKFGRKSQRAQKIPECNGDTFATLS
jgi:hypothetical protein